MNAYESAEVESIAVKPCLRRALTEYHTVIHRGGDVYSITSQSGHEYRIDAREGRCACHDTRYNLASNKPCKHVLRVAVIRGERVIPAAIVRDEVYSQFGIAVETTPVAVATDTGHVHAADATDASDRSADHEHERERPADCGCWGQDADLPCWPCYRAGFDMPNPHANG